MFRYNQYIRAVQVHLSGATDYELSYRMDEVEAMWYISEAWRKVKPTTILNCWNHTKVVDFKFKTASSDDEAISDDQQLPSEELPLDAYVVEKLNSVIPDLPGNGTAGSSMISSVAELDLVTVDEAALPVTQPCGLEVLSGGTADNEPSVAAETIEDAVTQYQQQEENEKEEDKEEEIDVSKARSDLKRAFETILAHTFCVNNADREFVKQARRRSNEIKAEEKSGFKQTDVRHFFAPRPQYDYFNDSVDLYE